MKATIWHNPSCGTSRKTLQILEETPGVEVTIVPYLEQPPTAANVLAAMAAEPILIERPLVETGKGVRLCRPHDKVREIL